uniref:Uncharacterized protein n=1 Tax=Arundo donax TaxID=35708 RepID=A0A0A9AZ02_ARUDO
MQQKKQSRVEANKREEGIHLSVGHACDAQCYSMKAKERGARPHILAIVLMREWSRAH